MTSFSSSVKDYLCAKSLEELGVGENGHVKWKECCRLSFLRSVFLFLAQSEEKQDILSSDRESLLEVIAYLLIRSFDLEARVLPRDRGNRKGAILSLPSGTRERILRETTSVGEMGCERCRVLFVRGAFLSCGTVLDPAKGYHAAFLLPGENEARELTSVLTDFDILVKKRYDSNGIYLYLKESSKIEDLLSVMGAQKFSLELMNQKIEKSIRANINRRQNFDDANIKKAVVSSQNIILSIRYLEEQGILETLSEPLQKAAKLRLSYPEVSLSELVERSEEEITKSGLNHRLQKLSVLAEKHKNEEDI